MTQEEALKLALEALKAMQMYAAAEKKGLRICDEAIIAAEEALAQPEQEPVEWPHKYGCRANAFGKCDMGCTTPPQRTWVGLTDEEVDECYYWKDRQWTTDELVRHVEAKLKEKNT